MVVCVVALVRAPLYLDNVTMLLLVVCGDDSEFGRNESASRCTVAYRSNAALPFPRLTLQARRRSKSMSMERRWRFDSHCTPAAPMTPSPSDATRVDCVVILKKCFT